MITDLVPIQTSVEVLIYFLFLIQNKSRSYLKDLDSQYMKLRENQQNLFDTLNFVVIERLVS